MHLPYPLQRRVPVVFLFSICDSSFAQPNTPISQFMRSVERSFGVPGLKDDSALLTISLLAAEINKKHVCDSIYFSDSAPGWQQAELGKAIKKLDLLLLKEYAAQNKHTGMLVFPMIIKSELIKEAIDELEIYDRFTKVFSLKAKPLQGKVVFFPPFVFVAGRIICELRSEERPNPLPAFPPCIKAIHPQHLQ